MCCYSRSLATPRALPFHPAQGFQGPLRSCCHHPPPPHHHQGGGSERLSLVFKGRPRRAGAGIQTEPPFHGDVSGARHPPTPKGCHLRKGHFTEQAAGRERWIRRARVLASPCAAGASPPSDTPPPNSLGPPRPFRRVGRETSLPPPRPPPPPGSHTRGFSSESHTPGLGTSPPGSRFPTRGGGGRAVAVGEGSVSGRGRRRPGGRRGTPRPAPPLPTAGGGPGARRGHWPG